jgi:A/G-specific adenine glycosylase
MKHGVTRYRITLDCYQAAYISGRIGGAKNGAVRWLPVRELSGLPLSTTGRRIAELVSHKDGR